MLKQALSDTDAFTAFVQDVESQPGYKRPAAHAIGLARYAQNGQILDVLYPHPNFQQHWGSCATFAAAADYLSGNRTHALSHGAVRSIEHAYEPFYAQPGHLNVEAFMGLYNAVMLSSGMYHEQMVATFIEDLSVPPETVEDVYLRLHLLSHRLVKPNTINLDGAFGILPVVAWTSQGPMLPDEVPSRRMSSWNSASPLTVRSVDRFPFMLDYVIPSNVRVVDASRVRLGAYLGEGTVVMPAGFVNFNAGTEGNCMIEGRVSQGVWIGANSDLGGGSSTMGTLSGGGTTRVSVGQNCLIGANAGIGFPIADRVTVEAGLYMTAGMKVRDLRDGTDSVRRAIAFSEQDDLLFRRNSLSGAVEVLRNEKPNKPNTILHTNT